MSETPANPDSLTARASNTVRNKNIILFLMCASFTVWFAYDGMIGWPERNDRIVKQMKGLVAERTLDPKYLPALENWPTWDNATSAQKSEMSHVVKQAGSRVERWEEETSVRNQLIITWALAAVSMGALCWLIMCQRRRVTADEHGLSPSPGLLIPWDRIKVVDNTLWNKKGYVHITYEGSTGAERKVTLDDYIVERLPLIEILKVIDARATRAEFLPKAGAEAPAES